MKNLRLLTLLLTLFVTAAATASAQSKTGRPAPPPDTKEVISNWKTFTFEKYKFRARFPEKPHLIADEIVEPGDDPSVYWEYSTGYLHLVVKIVEPESDYTARGFTPQKALETRRNNMLNAVKNRKPEIIKEYDFEQNGFPAKFLHISLGKSKPARCKLVQVGNKSYLAVAFTDNAKAAAAFLDSFELLK